MTDYNSVILLGSVFTVVNALIAAFTSLIIRRWDQKNIATQNDKTQSEYAQNLTQIIDRTTQKNLELEIRLQEIEAKQRQLTYGIYIIFTLDDPPIIHSVKIESISKDQLSSMNA